MKSESEEVGIWRNIPGRVVGGDYSCEEMVQMNAFMGGQLAVRAYHSWLTNERIRADTRHIFSCLLKGSYPRKEGRLQLW